MTLLEATFAASILMVGVGAGSQLLLMSTQANRGARVTTLSSMLARGKMDEANNLAEKGLWERYLETLETMTPLPKSTEDAYRLYDIGVAYEALAYQSEDKNATQKFLEKAAINYGKAIDANPGEKLFAEPQNRIETAVSHYKRLQGGATMEASSIFSGMACALVCRSASCSLRIFANAVATLAFSSLPAI